VWAARRCSRATEGQKKKEPSPLSRGLGSFTRTAGTHAEVRYRCFLPDLAGFTSPRCPDHKLFVPTTTAERVGFEPTIPFQIYTLSRRAPSTARPPLHETLCGERRIRTYDTVPGMPDFESGAFDHSASSPIFTCRVSSRAAARRSPSVSGGSRPPKPHSSLGVDGCAVAPRRGCRANQPLRPSSPSLRKPAA
jgi:hypothetical protein